MLAISTPSLLPKTIFHSVIHHRPYFYYEAVRASEEGRTYPFSRPVMKSLCGPSGVKLVIRNQWVFWLSRDPEFVATLYLIISDPVLVATSSGVSPSRPMRVNFANEEARLVVEKARALLGRARRRRKADMLIGRRTYDREKGSNSDCVMKRGDAG